MAATPNMYDDIGVANHSDNAVQLSPQTALVFNTSATNLNSASDEINGIYDSIVDTVADNLDVADSYATSLKAEHIGRVDNALQNIETVVGKTANALMTPPDNLLYAHAGDLMSNGIGVPVIPYDVAADLADETGEWVLQRLAGNAGPLQQGTNVEVFNQDAPVIEPRSPEELEPQQPVTPINLPPVFSPIPPLPPPNQSPLPPVGQFPPADIAFHPTTTICGNFMIRAGCQVTGNGNGEVQISCYDMPGTQILSPLGNVVGTDGWEFRSLGAQGPNGEILTVFTVSCGQLPSPVVPPTVPPALPIPPESCPAAQQCCPDPQVTVTVPPLTVPPITISPPVVPPLSPVPPRPPSSGDPPKFQKGLCWGDTTVCQVGPIISELEQKPRLASDFKAPTTESFLSSVMGEVMYAASELARATASAISPVFGDKGEEVTKQSQRNSATMTLGAGLVTSLINGPVGYCLPNPNAAVNLGAILSLISSAEDQSGMPMRYLGQSLIYEFQYANPQFIPTQPEINLHYLSNQISIDEWQCYTRAHGNHPTPHQRTIVGQQTRPNINEAIQLYLRKEITLDVLYVRLRELGVLEQQYKNEYLKLAEFIPPYSDIIRMMARDSADEQVAQQYNYDKDFDLKYNAQLRQWSESQGIDPKVAQYLWRAHWQIPSNTQLYEMMFRLRPDRPEVQQYNEQVAAWLNGGQIGDPPAKPLIFTPEDVQKAIEVNDMAPAFVPGLMQVAYRPLTRIDAQRAFEIGVFNSDQLYHAMRNGGYNEQDAKTLVGFYTQQKARRNANATGVWSIRKILNEYKKGTITYNAATQLLAPLIPTGQEIALALTGADQEVKSEVVAHDIKRWRKAYFTGSINATIAEENLVALGMDQSRVADLIAMWDSDRLGRYKEPTVTLIRKWAMVGIITAEDMYVRLLGLGYSDIDAKRIVYSAQHDINVAAQKEYEKLAKEAEKRFKDKLKFKQDTMEDLEKKRDEFEKYMEKVQKEIDKRKKELGIDD